MTIYLLTSMGALAGFIISLVTLAGLYFLLKQHIISNLIFRLKKELQAHGNKSHALLDDTLDHLLKSLKSQIPMSGLILTGSLLERLKEKLRGELDDILPDLLPKLILQAKEGLKDEAIKQFSKNAMLLLSVGTILGATFGAIIFMLNG